MSLRRSKRLKVAHSPPETNDVLPRALFSTMPEEILLNIFSNLHPIRHTTEDHLYSYGYACSNILDLLLVCRRWYRLIKPTLDASFQEVAHSRGNASRWGWIWCLQQVLRKPELGTQLKSLWIDLNVTRGWDKKVHSGHKEAEKWSGSEITMAADTIEEICHRDIWNAYPMEPTGDDWDDEIVPDQAYTYWMGDLIHGHYPAVLALLLALASNVEKLVLINYNALEDGRGNLLNPLDTWADQDVIGDDANILERFFRGAINSQRSAAKEDGRAKDVLLQKLRSLKIVGELESENGYIEAEELLPYLMLPSLDKIKLRRVYYMDDDFDDEEDLGPGVELGIRTLDVNYSTFSTTGVCKILKSCPKIETLKYSADSKDHFPLEQAWPPLMGFVHHCAPKLKHIELADGWYKDEMDDPEITDGLERMKQLETLSLKWDHVDIAISEGTTDLWHLLPPGIQSITITRMWPDHFPDLTRQINALAAALEEGRIPNLKEITVRHVRSRRVIQREEDEDDVAGLDEACRSAPISVVQVYEGFMDGDDDDDDDW